MAASAAGSVAVPVVVCCVVMTMRMTVFIIVAVGNFGLFLLTLKHFFFHL